MMLASSRHVTALSLIRFQRSWNTPEEVAYFRLALEALLLLRGFEDKNLCRKHLGEPYLADRP
jgi:hypothetical protein